MSDCIQKVKDRLKEDSTVTLEEVKQMLVDVQNKMDAGLPDDELLKNIKDITGARKEKLKRLALMNKLNNYQKRQSRISHVQDLMSKDEDFKFLGQTIYSAEEHAFMQPVYNFENAVMASTGYEVSSFEATLRKQDLLEYAKDPKNQIKYYEELEAQQVVIKDNRPTESVTGDDTAFNLAKATVEKQDELNVRLGSEGSTVGYKEKRITGQMWSSEKIARDFKKDEWVDTMIETGTTYNGIVPPRAEWDRIYSEIVQNTFIDDEAIFDVKKQFQNSRKIEMSKDAYLKYADKMMEGDSLYHRVLLDIERQARQVAILQHYGTNAKQQYSQILDHLIVNNKDSNSKLNTQFYKETLPAYIFGEVNRVNSREAALVKDAFKIIKGGSVLSKLGSVLITSQMDWPITATRQAMLRGDNSQGVVQELFDSFKDLEQLLKERNVFDSQKVVDDEKFASQVMLESTLTELLSEVSRYDINVDTTDSSKLMKRILQFQGKAIKMQGAEWFTRLKQQASYNGVGRILGEFSTRSFNELNSFLQKRLREADINEAEWDFIRANGVEGGRIMGSNLRALDPKAFKGLNPEAKSIFALTKMKNDLVTKLQVFMFKEAKTMTIEPSGADRARMANVPILGSGTAQAGTLPKELSDLTMQFRAFSWAHTTKFLLPLLRDGNKATQFQYIGAAVAMGLAVTQLKDSLFNRQRDWLDPQNWYGLVGLALGFPFLDNAMGLFNSDTRVDKAFVNLFGAVPGDAIAFGSRFWDLYKKSMKGDADMDDFKKAIGKTIGPAVFLRSYPIAGPIYETLMYDGYMDSIDPSWSLEKEKKREERGFTKVVGR